MTQVTKKQLRDFLEKPFVYESVEKTLTESIVFNEDEARFTKENLISFIKKYGYSICGGSVSDLILDLKRRHFSNEEIQQNEKVAKIETASNVKINDIDIFISNETFHDGYVKSEGSETTIFNLLSGLQRNADRDKKRSSAYPELNNSDEILLSFSSVVLGNVNFIFYNVKPDQDLKDVEYVLSSFDINCCMSGITLSDKKLSYTPQFVNFLKSEVISPQNLVTFTNINVYARCIRKSKNLGCKFFHEDFLKKLFYKYLISYPPVIDTLDRLISYSFSNDLAKKMFPENEKWDVDTTYDKKLDDLITCSYPIYRPEFSLLFKEAETYLPFFKIREVRAGYGYGSVICEFNENYMEDAGSNPTVSKARKSPLAGLYFTENGLWNHMNMHQEKWMELLSSGAFSRSSHLGNLDTRTTESSVFELLREKGLFKKEISNFTISTAKRIFESSKLKSCSPSAASAQIVIKQTSCPNELIRVFNEWDKAATELVKRAKHLSKLSLFGLLETYLSKSNVEMVSFTRKSFISFALKNDVLSGKGIRTRENLPYKKYIEEILSERRLLEEGLIMQHCVGGYWLKVREGDSRIFSIESSKGRSTIEVVYKGDRFQTAQHQAKRNTPPPLVNKKIAERLLLYLNNMTAKPNPFKPSEKAAHNF